MRTFVLLTILFFTTLGFAQNTGSIAGKLIDKEFNDEDADLSTWAKKR